MSSNYKDLVNLSMTKDATSFVKSVNTILSDKANKIVADMKPQVASKMFNGKEGYKPASEGDKAFVDQHTIQVHDYPVENTNGAPFRDDRIDKADHDGRPPHTDEAK